MDVGVLGPIVMGADGTAVPLRRGRQQALVALLALAPGRRVDVGRIVEALWPHRPPGDPGNAVHHLVAQVRRALGPHRALLCTVDRGYRLDLPVDATDLGRVTAARAAADRAVASGDLAGAGDHLTTALSTWRGASLGGHEDGVLGIEARRLDDLRADLEVELADLAAADQAGAEMVDQLARACARHPLHEPLWERWIAAIARAGRRAEALATYEGLRRRLSDELGVDPSGPLQALHTSLLRERGSAPHPPAVPLRGTGLPASLTSFVGRDRELALLARWRRDGVRLITLVGPGGVGKTRLAIEHRRAHDGPTVLARLEQVTVGGDVVAAVAAALGVREVGTRGLVDVVVDAVPPDSVLLLDNAEHVLPAVSELALGVLRARPDIAFVVTSRAPSGLAEEQVLRVEPLARGDALDVDSGASAPAARLLLERAALVRPGLAHPGEADRAAAIAIAEAVDGLPLAIELAAARAAVLTLPQIAASLGDRLGLLDATARGRPPRHRRMSDATAWSVELLSDTTRDLFTACAVFSGPFTGASAGLIADVDASDALLGLVELADHSLIQTEDGPEPRFRMLGPMRAYGLTALERSGRSEQMLDRLLVCVHEVVGRATVGIRSRDQMAWMEHLDQARGDIDRALDHAVSSDHVDAAISIVADLGRYWDWRGRVRDAARWITRVRAAAGDDADHPRWGAVLAWAGFLAFEQGRPNEAEELSRRAEHVAIARHDDEGLMTALAIRATVARGRGRFADAAQAIAEAGTVVAHADDSWASAWTINSRGHVHAALGDLDAADADAQESTRRFRALGDQRAVQWGIALSALVAHHRGDGARARDLAQRVRRFALRCGDLRTATLAYEILAGQAQDDREQDRLSGAAAELRERRGQVSPRFRDVG